MPWLWSKVVTGVASVSRRRTRRQRQLKREAELAKLAERDANRTNTTNATDSSTTRETDGLRGTGDIRTGTGPVHYPTHHPKHEILIFTTRQPSPLASYHDFEAAWATPVKASPHFGRVLKLSLTRTSLLVLRPLTAHAHVNRWHRRGGWR